MVPAGSRALEIAEQWRAGRAQAGHDGALGEGLALVLQIHLADNEEEAIREATPWFEEQLKVLAPLGRMPALTAAQIDATYDGAAAPRAGLPTVRDLVADGAWLCGPPEHIAEKLAAIQAQLPGLERVTIGAGALGIPPSAIKRNIEWFGREVLPKFQESP